MATWTRIGDEGDFPSGTKSCIDGENRKLVVCNVDGQLFAASNTCPHAGLPLGEGELRGKILTCPFHGFTYNIENGVNIDMPDDEPLPTILIRVEAGRVEVKLPAAS